MKKIISWGTPKYIQEDHKLEKHQFEEEPRLVHKKKRYCIKTKGDHEFSEKIPQKSDWWYKSWEKGEWKEFICLCGKKKIEIKSKIFDIVRL